ncbi:oligosaccharide flippase family protein [Coprobacillaceae bacterium CR2/5/TPMF4]|nr:oligosaccharide flippase family protein [Coprobacillaceae bacterium CR2/5/TPMF4]
MNRIFSNMFWKFGERIVSQLVLFIVSVVLARLLSPAEYGSISIILVFITIAEVFVTNGLGSALIQKLDADIVDFSSVFYINLLFSIILYFVVFLYHLILLTFMIVKYCVQH